MAYSFGADTKKKNTNFVNWKDKTFKLKKPVKDAGAVGPVNRLRFLGDPIKYYYHYTGKKEAHKICPSSLSIRNPDREVEGQVIKGDYVWKQDNGNGQLISYTQEQMSCPLCDAKDKPRKYYAINVIDVDEAQDLAKQQKPPQVRIMEFSSRIYDKLSKYYKESGIHPSDRDKGPVFELVGSYPEEIDEPQDKDILWKVKPLKTAPINESTYKILFEGENKKVFDLVEEYHPLHQKFRSVHQLGVDNSSVITGKAKEQEDVKVSQENKPSKSEDSFSGFGDFSDNDDEPASDPVYNASNAEENAAKINDLLSGLDLA